MKTMSLLFLFAIAQVNLTLTWNQCDFLKYMHRMRDVYQTLNEDNGMGAAWYDGRLSRKYPLACVETLILYGSPLYSLNKDNDSLITNIVKYQLWYSPKAKETILIEHHNELGAITAPIAFSATYQTLKNLESKINTSEPIKNINQNISEKNRRFIYHNSKIITAAGVAEFSRTLVEQGTNGINKTNLQTFGKKAAIHAGAECIREYVAPSVSQHLLGKDYENSATQYAMEFGITLAGLYILNAVLGQ